MQKGLENFLKIAPHKSLQILLENTVYLLNLRIYLPAMRNYRKYEVWKDSHDLVKFIYRHITPGFPNEEKYGLTSQMKRAAYSIPFNIVEGCGRHSEKDFTHFLDTSLGSANELEYCIILTSELGYMDTEKYQLLIHKIGIIRAKLINLIKFFREPKN